MPTVSVAELHEILQNNQAQNVIDVRTPVEFAEVHVEAAQNVPLDIFKPEELYENYKLSLDKPVYILCRSGQRATRAYEQLTKAGFPNSLVVKGGTLAWVEAGFPVKRGQARVISLERQVRIGAGSLVLLGVILAQVIHPSFIWLSAFVGSGLIFAGITDWCGMGLLLAKAPWNQKA